MPQQFGSLKSERINLTATADIVAAIAGKQIVVVGFNVSNGNVAATTLNFRSGAAGNFLAGPYELAATGGGFSSPGNRNSPQFATTSGETLRGEIDTAGPVGGVVTYYEF